MELETRLCSSCGRPVYSGSPIPVLVVDLGNGTCLCETCYETWRKWKVAKLEESNDSKKAVL